MEIPVEAEQDDSLTEFDEEYLNLLAMIPPAVRKVVEKVGWRIKNEGMTVEEACIVCNVGFDWMEKKIIEHPVIARGFRKKELEYRTTLMAPLNKKAKLDDRMAQYLLERRFPPKKKSEDNDSPDMIAAAISHIQENGDSTPLVSRTSNTAVFLGRGPSATKLMDKIKALLPKEKLV